LKLSFRGIGPGEEPRAQVDAYDLVHVKLQPNLNKPPRAIDARYPLAGIHLGNCLMKHMVYTAQKEFSQRKAVAAGQMDRHCDMIQSGFIGLATEDKPA
jgi:hypothetical protein